VAARALEFSILTATRTWTVPGGKMKASRKHRAPLSDEAVKMLKALQENRITRTFLSGQELVASATWR
jgi:hypothetical protein